MSIEEQIVELENLIGSNVVNIHEIVNSLESNAAIIVQLIKTDKAQKKAIEELSERVVVLEEESTYVAMLRATGSH